jgi:hypothetical protein
MVVVVVEVVLHEWKKLWLLISCDWMDALKGVQQVAMKIDMKIRTKGTYRISLNIVDGWGSGSSAGGHGLGGMKSSSSSAPSVADGGGGGGRAAWLEEALDFPCLRWDASGSSAGGHGLGGMKSSSSSAPSVANGGGGGGRGVWLEEPLDFPCLRRLKPWLNPRPKMSFIWLKFGNGLFSKSASSGKDLHRRRRKS